MEQVAALDQSSLDPRDDPQLLRERSRQGTMGLTRAGDGAFPLPGAERASYSLDPEMRRQFPDTKFNKRHVYHRKDSPGALALPRRGDPPPLGAKSPLLGRLAAVIDTLYLALAHRGAAALSHSGWTTSA